jgi:hypothetical protein
MLEQTLIPGSPDGALNVGKALSILEKEGRVTYFVGGDNYFAHPSGDAAARRFALATLMENGHVRAVDLAGEPLFMAQRTLMNWTAQLRRDGADSFVRAPPPRKPRVMNETVGASCASLLADGHRPSEVAGRVGIKESTLRKAMQRKAVPELPKSPECADGSAASTAERGDQGAAAPRPNAAARTRRLLRASARPAPAPMSAWTRRWGWRNARPPASSAPATFRWQACWRDCPRCVPTDCSADWAST